MSLIQSPCPKNMVSHWIEKSFKVSPEKMEFLWEQLNRRETFVKGQMFPYRVEFEKGHRQGAFNAGELNIHHGPLLSLHGRIGEISPTYRDLQYFYGSYVLSFRWIRPTRLEFFRRGECLDLKIHAYVKPSMVVLWNWGNNFFWKYLGIQSLL